MTSFDKFLMFFEPSSAGLIRDPVMWIAASIIVLFFIGVRLMSSWMLRQMRKQWY